MNTLPHLPTQVNTNSSVRQHLTGLAPIRKQINKGVVEMGRKRERRGSRFVLQRHSWPFLHPRHEERPPPPPAPEPPGRAEEHGPPLEQSSGSRRGTQANTSHDSGCFSLGTLYRRVLMSSVCRGGGKSSGLILNVSRRCSGL